MFRNREIRQFAVLFLILTIVVFVVGFMIAPAAGGLVLISSAVYATIFFLFTRTRYERIAQISEQIDRVLHNADHIDISNEEEGELSILQSEVQKMTLRIREQNAALKKEKELLADSLADIAHQLRTPLTSISLILSLLENDAEESERKNLLREMDGLLVRMDWLITALLKLSRLDAGMIVFQKQQIRVIDLIRSAVQPLLIPMDLHNITLQFDVSEDVGIQGDMDWLAEALQNILKNCMESTGDNGRIVISCEDTLLYTQLAVHDSGAGIPQEDFACLFDRFYKGKNSSAAGYGIGLALCKTIITRQGGTICAKNHPQGGAIFYIRFPKDQELSG